MRSLVLRVVVFLGLMIGLCILLDLGSYGELMIVILSTITLSSVCGLKDSNRRGVIIIVDKFRVLRDRMSLEAWDGRLQSRSKAIQR